MDHIVAGRHELLALGHDAAQSLPHQIIWTSRDGLHWRRVATNPFGILTQPPTITALGSGFVALMQYDNEPALWWSANGSRWKLVAGAEVFGGGFTAVSDAVAWRNGLLVVGQTSSPLVLTTSTTAPVISSRPTAWRWTPGAPNAPHPNWTATDPLYFRLHLADLGPQFIPRSAPLSAGYGMACDLPPDFPPALAPGFDRTRCTRELALLDGSIAYNFNFGLLVPSYSNLYGPEVTGFAILARDAAQARAAYRWGGGLVIAGDLNMNDDDPQVLGTVKMAQGGTLYSIATQQLGTADAVVWRAGRALGMVEAVGLPGDLRARAITLARVQWRHWQAVGR
jgi:hypothetical protein